MSAFADILARHAQVGRVDWIGLRPERLGPVTAVEQAELTEAGLVGDHSRAGKRALTLIQSEHLPVIAALAGLTEILPHTLRRNLTISGINLTALRNRPVRIGNAIVEFSTVCAPCSRMEKAMGHGAYNAMRGHGGWCASVLQSGVIRIGDPVTRAD